jgi:hypothetical protein
MKIKLDRPKKIILPLLLFISLCFNILYFFNIIDIRINLIPSATQKLPNKTFKHYWDSHIDQPETIRINDSLDRNKLKINPADTLKIKSIN